MKKILILSLFSALNFSAQQIPTLTDEIAAKLAEKPVKCINQEYPNKTAHVINAEKDAVLTPLQLHP